MSWERIILATAGNGDEVPGLVERLFAQQRETFPTFREGEAALTTVRTKELVSDGARIVVQVNPRRRRSTYAKTDAASLAERPCFLCPANIPAEERGIAFGDLVLLPNPYPILARHCTVAVRDHVPQRIAGRVGSLLELARAIGPELLAFYNGPRSGASAPDHFHFQVCEAAAAPLLGELKPGCPVPLTTFGRRCLIFEEVDLDRARARLEAALAALERIDPVAGEEAMVNVVAWFGGGQVRTALFPRARHRPACFDAAGDARIAVSPGALEMAGVMVVAEPEHFERVDVAAAAAIYDEVSILPERFARLVEEVE